MTLTEAEKILGKTLMDHQSEALKVFGELPEPKRICLYHRTGAGKSITALLTLVLNGWTSALVIAPKSTHKQWVDLGESLGMNLEIITHAKFRQPNYLVSRSRPVVADEFHMLGGHKGVGWKKMDRLAASLQAPMILGSATPNYNDVERCYCVEKVLDPPSVKGGFLNFIYTHCITQENPWSVTPTVEKFREYANAEAYLVDLPNVVSLPDPYDPVIIDIFLESSTSTEFENMGLDRRNDRIMASDMEKRWARRRMDRTTPNGKLKLVVYDVLERIAGQVAGPLLVFSESTEAAAALYHSALDRGVTVGLITGATKEAVRENFLDSFRKGQMDLLIGTSALATGTDGIDKVCDTMVILDDTSDPSLRRQLMGRILPRGLDVDYSKKQFFRILFY